MKVLLGILLGLFVVFGCRDDDDTEVVINLNKDFQMLILPSLTSNEEICILESSVNNCIDLSIDAKITENSIDLFLTNIEQSSLDLACKSHTAYPMQRKLSGKYDLAVHIDETVIDKGTVDISKGRTEFDVPDARLVNFLSMTYEELPKNMVFGRFTYAESSADTDVILDTIASLLGAVPSANAHYGYIQISDNKPIIKFGLKKDFNQDVFAGTYTSNAQKQKLIDFLRTKQSNALEIELYGVDLVF